ncbi:protein DMP2 [Dendrobium catenatum]|uniref:Protein DMP2 n=1 Tax=Dendrobium catenatum TaxID=906689 RepID=A0A2I0WE40_9ASPA|nr:protein DMP2 [Dendrobium catenatum]PKU73892.1 hypothetical protein MA16_Dca023309 [Dendrobium catenatum]
MAALIRKQQKALSFSDRAFKSLGDLIKLLPSGTVFLFQFLNPLVTNNGHCSTVNKYLSGALLAICGFFCCFSTFTDSYVGSDGRVYYGIATRTGLWTFSDPDAAGRDLSKYKLRAGDFVHAVLSVVVFAVVALLDADTVRCFYPAAEAEEAVLVKVLPTVVGGMVSTVFVAFPNQRHGIGYPPATSPEEDY